MEEPVTRHIVVADDDVELRGLVAEFLEEQGFKVSTAANGLELDRVLSAGPVDLIVLDLMMPGEDGLTIIRRLRTAGPHIIMLSARGDEYDRIVGLEVGADDYIAKPCNPRELLARIRAVLRRGEANSVSEPRIRLLGQWTVDCVERSISSDGDAPIALTDGEFRILIAFLERPLRVVSRDQLIEATRGYESEVFDRTIDVAISRLRKKMGPECPIRTVRHEGYMLTQRPSW